MDQEYPLDNECEMRSWERNDLGRTEPTLVNVDGLVGVWRRWIAFLPLHVLRMPGSVAFLSDGVLQSVTFPFRTVEIVMCFDVLMIRGIESPELSVISPADTLRAVEA